MGSVRDDKCLDTTPEIRAITLRSRECLRCLHTAIRELYRKGGAATIAGPREEALASLGQLIAVEAAPVRLFVVACRCFRALAAGSSVVHFGLGDLGLLTAELDQLRTVADRRVRLLISQYQSRPHELPATCDIAKAWRLTPSAVTPIVVRAMHVNLAGLRIALRCRPAMSKLVGTDERVSQIAYLVGYKHPSQLDHDFRRLVGLAPRVFRRVCAKRVSIMA